MTSIMRSSKAPAVEAGMLALRRDATEVVSCTKPMLWRDHALDLLQQGYWSGPDADHCQGRCPRCGDKFCAGDSPGMQSERSFTLHAQVNHEDFNEGIIQVQAKKKANLSYYA